MHHIVSVSHYNSTNEIKGDPTNIIDQIYSQNYNLFSASAFNQLEKKSASS
jgi:hypothetical protein